MSFYFLLPQKKRKINYKYASESAAIKVGSNTILGITFNGAKHTHLNGDYALQANNFEN